MEVWVARLRPASGAPAGIRPQVSGWPAL